MKPVKPGYEFLHLFYKDGNKLGLKKCWVLSKERLRVKIFIAARVGRSSFVSSLFADGAMNRIYHEEGRSRGRETVNIIYDDITKEIK